MKKLLFILLMLSGSCYAQELVFNLEKNKEYKIQIQGIKDSANADFIARKTEKMGLCIFSYVDYISGYGYFIVDNFYKVHEIEKMINNINGLAYIRYEEIALNEDNFLEMYMNRGGYKYPEFPVNIPKEIVLGPYKELTYSLFSKEISIWKNTYSKAYNKSKGFPEHYPIFIITGNPEDNIKTDQEKQSWMVNYPDEYEQLVRKSTERAKGSENQKDIEKVNPSNK